VAAELDSVELDDDDALLSSVDELSVELELDSVVELDELLSVVEELLSDELSVVELLLSVDEDCESVLLDDSSLELSLFLSLELLSLALLLSSVVLLEDFTTLLLVALAPLTVFVVLFTTTLVAPSAKTIETIANGVINGGVR